MDEQLTILEYSAAARPRNRRVVVISIVIGLTIAFIVGGLIVNAWLHDFVQNN